VVDDLPLQVGELHRVGIGDADGADPRRGQVKGGRGTAPAGADDQDPAVQKPPLPFSPNLQEEDMAGLPFDLVVAKHGHLPLSVTSYTAMTCRIP
jgi:hypothetical protein